VRLVRLVRTFFIKNRIGYQPRGPTRPKLAFSPGEGLQIN
jgi:hypothetical protein